jgi:hypothetical protein
MGDGTAASAVMYLDNLVDKGKASKGAINPLKIAFTKVMQTIDGKDSWRSVQVSSVDVEDYMNRFANLTMGKYSAESLTVYKSRVKKVVEWYLMFLEKPGWAPEIQRRNRSGITSAKAVTPASSSQAYERPVESDQAFDSAPAQAPVVPVAQLAHAAQPQLPQSPDRVVYPFPLADGQLVHISLPFNLTKTDARRIGAFVESIGREDLEAAE